MVLKTRLFHLTSIVGTYSQACQSHVRPRDKIFRWSLLLKTDFVNKIKIKKLVNKNGKLLG